MEYANRVVPDPKEREKEALYRWSQAIMEDL
jgi:hypothetical protein